MPVAGYDDETQKAYLEYPDGRRVYKCRRYKKGYIVHGFGYEASFTKYFYTPEELRSMNEIDVRGIDIPEYEYIEEDANADNDADSEEIDEEVEVDG